MGTRAPAPVSCAYAARRIWCLDLGASHLVASLPSGSGVVECMRRAHQMVNPALHAADFSPRPPTTFAAVGDPFRFQNYTDFITLVSRHTEQSGKIQW